MYEQYWVTRCREIDVTEWSGSVTSRKTWNEDVGLGGLDQGRPGMRMWEILEPSVYSMTWLRTKGAGRMLSRDPICPMLAWYTYVTMI